MIPQNSWLCAFSIAVAAMGFMGCAEKEKVLEVDAPGFNLDVEKEKDGSGVTIDTDNEKSGTTIDIDSTRRDGDGVEVDVRNH